MNDKIWISNNIFNSYGSVGISKLIDNELWERSYEIWEHACGLIDKPKNEFSLTDGIANLKRLLNHRLQLIEKLYCFKEIDFANKPKGYLELLENYGIVRPFIMKELLKIRNGIEHYDQRPPDVIRCKELSDIIWYFLKSTDNIVQQAKYHIDFIILDDNKEETEFRYAIELDWEHHNNLKVKGWIPGEYISYCEKDEFIEVIKCDKYKLLENFADKGKIVTGNCL